MVCGVTPQADDITSATVIQGWFETENNLLLCLTQVNRFLLRRHGNITVRLICFLLPRQVFFQTAMIPDRFEIDTNPTKSFTSNPHT
jgi:hypothetical protein